MTEAAENAAQATEAESPAQPPPAGAIVRHGADDDVHDAEFVTEQQRAIMPAAIGPAGVALLPVEEQQAVLAEYSKRRECLHKWLFAQMKPGIHYGFPHKVEFNDAGEMLVYDRKKKHKIAVPKNQWRAKPSLYKAGAMLILDLLQCRPHWVADPKTATMVGPGEYNKPAIAYACEIRGPAGESLGFGGGVFRCGEKGMNADSSAKMARKRALTDAVLNAFPFVGELFTQDDPGTQPTPEARPQTAQDPAAQSAPNRQERSGHAEAQAPAIAPEAMAVWNNWRGKAAAMFGKAVLTSPKLGGAFFDWMGEVIGRRVKLDLLTADEIATLAAELDEFADPRPPSRRPKPDDDPADEPESEPEAEAESGDDIPF